MQEAHGWHTVSFETLTGKKLENRVRRLCCSKKRWFHLTKHAARLISVDYAMEYIPG
jgi:hypothetical protein